MDAIWRRTEVRLPPDKGRQLPNQKARTRRAEPALRVFCWRRLQGKRPSRFVICFKDWSRGENLALRDKVAELDRQVASLKKALEEAQRLAARQAAVRKAVIALWKARPAMDTEAFAAERARIEGAVQRLLDERVVQPGDVAIRNRLLKQQPHLLGCLHEPAAEPTNNRAERALRPAVIARTLSCGNRTQRGRRTWQILASVAATCQQNADDFIDWLAPRLSLAMQAG